MDTKTLRCGLLGRKLGHSYSPAIHERLADYSYRLFEVEPEDLGAFLQEGAFDGLNVTIPYKKDVIPYCAELSDTARAIGAVNTLVRRADGTLWGDNTDAYGFSMLVQSSGADVAGKKALVFGSGGASATAQYVLRQLGAREVVVWGTGTPRREFLYSDDMGDACVFLMNLPDDRFDALLGSDESVSGRFEPPLINIGVGEDVTIAELAALIAQTIGFEGRIVYDPSQPDGTPRKLMDVGLLNAAGWRAKTGLAAGLRRAHADFVAQEQRP